MRPPGFHWPKFANRLCERSEDNSFLGAMQPAASIACNTGNRDLKKLNREFWGRARRLDNLAGNAEIWRR
jgi:hypothetical protein